MKKIALLAMAVCVLALTGCDKSSSKGPSEKALKQAAETGDYSKLPVSKNPKTKKAYVRSGSTIRSTILASSNSGC